MLLADLKSMAGGMGIAGAGSMKKAQLVEAIKAAQGGTGGGTAKSAPATTKPAPATEKAARATDKPEPATEKTAPATEKTAPETDRAAPATQEPAPARVVKTTRTRGGASRTTAPKADAQPESQPETATDSARDSARDTGSRSDNRDQDNRDQDGRADAGGPAGETTGRQRTRNRQANQQTNQQTSAEKQPPEQGGQQNGQQGGQREKTQQAAEARSEPRQAPQQEKQAADQGQGRSQQAQQGQQQGTQQAGGQQGGQQGQADDLDDDGEGGSRRNRRRRGRDRDRDRQGVRATGGRNEPDTTVLEDDVLVPAAGILDVLDNYAFVRTSGYLPGTDDVYLSLSMVRKFGLRRGDAVMGQVRQPREGERKEKFNPMVRIDSINGTDPEAARERLEFETFTPVHPTERLRLETDAANLTGRVIDIAAPVGKGQRGMIVAPPKSGRTTMLQSIAGSVSRNNPDVHLMVVLLDARPEEVTDFQRAVKGEVIASTFDRPASDHTMVAELAIERAKRLVELGHDVLVLLDSLTSLARAYNVSAPASGRTLAGGVDAAAVHPPKQLFGAARNVEGGGSLTVLATVLVETGSATDEVIFEELGGTANMELRLRRELARAHTFPAVDIVASGTRQEALLTSEQESGIVQSLRSRMASDPVAAVPALLEQLGKAQNNIEFLTKQQKPGRAM